MKKEHYDSLDQLFTKRNLRAAAMIYEAIEQESSPQLRKFLLGAFTSMIHLCTRMMPVGNPGEGNHQTLFSSPGWTQHSYWSAPRFLEQNVWEKFESAVTGHQGIINAKNESNELLGDVKVTDDWRKVLAGEADIAVVTDDCVELMKKMPEECVDYMFTDPPYDASIQYGELSYLWNAWLKADFRYTERIVDAGSDPQRAAEKAIRGLSCAAQQQLPGLLQGAAAGTLSDPDVSQPDFHGPQCDGAGGRVFGF